MRLCLVRHPAPVLDARYCYGRSDIAVAPEVLAACCEQVWPLLPPGGVIHSSPLQRCADLARVLAPRLGDVEVVFDDDLQEMDFGHWEQRPWDDIPWAEVQAWNDDLLHYAPGGGETLLDVARRVWRCFEGLRRAAGDCVVVGHGGSIRMLCACAAWHQQHWPALPRAAQAVASPPWAALALDAAKRHRAIGFGEVIILDVAASLAQTPGQRAAPAHRA